MEITVTKNDINKIGHTIFSDNGYTAIVCNIDTSNIEEILLRNILKCFGQEYIITNSYDYPYSTDHDEIIFITNLPFEMCMNEK